MELVTLRARQAILPATFVAVGLRHPVANCLGRRLELFCQLLRRAAATNQLDHLVPELRRIRRASRTHRELLKRKCSGVHETGSTSLTAPAAVHFSTRTDACPKFTLTLTTNMRSAYDSVVATPRLSFR